jgi:hypothetical protein
MKLATEHLTRIPSTHRHRQSVRAPVQIHVPKEMSKVLQTPFVTVMVTSSKTLREMVTPMVKVTPLLEVHCPGRHTVQGSTHQHLRTQHLMTVHLLQMPERCRRGKSRGAVRVK